MHRRNFIKTITAATIGLTLPKRCNTQVISNGMEICIKVGTKWNNLSDKNHTVGWRDGQIIDIRQGGYYNSRMCRRHHCVIELPNIDFWSTRGSTNWKSISAKTFDLKKIFSIADSEGRYKWESGFTESKNRKRDYFIDFQDLLNNNYISLSDYESIYAKDKDHNRIILGGIHDFTSLLKHEDIDTRLNLDADTSKGSESAGTFSIGSGLDYNDVTTFEADIEAQLTGNLTGEHNNEETAISSYVTFAIDTNSYLFQLTAQSGDEHNGSAYGNGARINLGAGDALYFDETNDGDMDDVEVSNLAIDASGASNVGLYFADGANSGIFTVNRMLIKGDGSTDYPIRVDAGVADIIITNSIIYDFSGGYVRLGGTTAAAYNNTIIGCSYGILRAAGTVTIKNNLVQASVNDDYSGAFTSSKNISEDATSPDEAYDNTDVHTNSIFQNYAGKDFRLDSAGDSTNLAIADDGDDLSVTFNDDIQGQTRATWYIGASEILAASAATRKGQIIKPQLIF